MNMPAPVSNSLRHDQQHSRQKEVAVRRETIKLTIASGVVPREMVRDLLKGFPELEFEFRGSLADETAARERGA